MFSQQCLRRLVHAFCIKRIVYPPGTMAVQRGALKPIENQVTVAARGGRKPCMKAVINRLSPNYADVVRQIAVRTEQPATTATFTVCVEMHNLTGRMNAGIGSTGTNNFDFFVGDSGQRVFKTRLHTFAGALALPAIVRRSVVLQT